MKIIETSDVEIIKCPVCKQVIDNGTEFISDIKPCKHMKIYVSTSMMDEDGFAIICSKIGIKREIKRLATEEENEYHPQTIFKAVKNRMKDKAGSIVYLNKTYLGGCQSIYSIIAYLK